MKVGAEEIVQGGEEQLRLFAAIELPVEWISALAGAMPQLTKAGGNGFKWVKLELMHLTLVFLGNHGREALPVISSALARGAASCRPFQLSLGRLGAFGPTHAPTVVWAGLAETPSGLKDLHLSVTGELAASHITFDQKPLAPHITIARGRRPADHEASRQVSALIARLPLPRLTARVDQFALLRSRLSPAGPSYEKISDFNLGENHGS